VPALPALLIASPRLEVALRVAFPKFSNPDAKDPKNPSD